ncbi:hypothetical protein [Streptomyces sp. NPDC048172]|uniref:hypothetical protein n=1 Tax=Streptomyces sp. NPDC048172 TaxID=3365505 RepID=UPI00371F3F79
MWPEQQQPGNGQWGPAGTPGGPPGAYGTPPGPPPRRRRLPVAVAVGMAVVAVAAASVAGYLVLGDDGGDGKDGKDETKADTSASPSREKRSPERAKDPSKPVVRGWRTVASPKQYAAFDVPKSKDWKPQDTTWVDYVEDADGNPVVGLNAPAHYKEEYCKDNWLGSAGTSGAKDAGTTAQAARQKTADWAKHNFDPKGKGSTEATRAKPFRNSHGVRGHIARATVTGVPEDKKSAACPSSGGKVVTVAWINGQGDIATWSAVSDTGAEEPAIPEKVIRKMAASLRPYETQDETRDENEPRG